MANGYKALKDFRDDANYVRVHRYTDYERIQSTQVLDPPQECNKTLWSRMGDAINAQPTGYIKTGLFNAFSDRITLRPEEVWHARIVLNSMLSTVESVMQCLALHGKDTATETGKDEQARYGVEWMRPEHVEEGYGASVLDGRALAIEKEFYPPLGRIPWTRGQMLQLLREKDTFGRVLYGSSGILGFTLFRGERDVLNLLGWGVTQEKRTVEQGGPERLVGDLLEFTSPSSPHKFRYSTIFNSVAQQHPFPPKTVLAQQSYF
ncbi:MAG: hypothetical protein Q7R81_06180 [Candidatus Peregrinibacteria bacterium]|nr:hypothetical protein [Candidatus Peregrinibacteria bacterium]